MRGRLLAALCCLSSAAAWSGESRPFAELESSLQLSGRVGVGAWSEGDTSALFPGQAGAAAGKLSPGPSYGAEFLYRGSPGWALGVSGGWSAPGTGSESRKVSGRELRALLRLLSGDPGAASEWALDLSFGKGTLTAEAPGDSLSLESWTAGVRASLDFRPLAQAPWMRVGPYLGADAWFATRRCVGATCADVAELEYTDVLLSLGLGARFDLPLSYRPVPREEYVEVDSQVRLESPSPWRRR